MHSPVFITTGYDPDGQQTEIVGAFDTVTGAKGLADDHRLMLDQTTPGHSIRIFIEEWHGGTFYAQRELRRDGWYLAEAPQFVPIKES